MGWSESYNVSLRNESNENKQSQSIFENFAWLNSLSHSTTGYHLILSILMLIYYSSFSTDPKQCFLLIFETLLWIFLNQTLLFWKGKKCRIISKHQNKVKCTKLWFRSENVWPKNKLKGEYIWTSFQSQLLVAVMSLWHSTATICQLVSNDHSVWVFFLFFKSKFFDLSFFVASDFRETM